MKYTIYEVRGAGLLDNEEVRFDDLTEAKNYSACYRGSKVYSLNVEENTFGDLSILSESLIESKTDYKTVSDPSLKEGDKITWKTKLDSEQQYGTVIGIDGNFVNIKAENGRETYLYRNLKKIQAAKKGLGLDEAVCLNPEAIEPEDMIIQFELDDYDENGELKSFDALDKSVDAYHKKDAKTWVKELNRMETDPSQINIRSAEDNSDLFIDDEDEDDLISDAEGFIEELYTELKNKKSAESLAEEKIEEKSDASSIRAKMINRLNTLDNNIEEKVCTKYPVINHTKDELEVLDEDAENYIDQDEYKIDLFDNREAQKKVDYFKKHSK